MTTKEYSAYIKGLMEGLNLDESKPENKVIKALCGIIEQMAGEIETLEKNTETLHDYIEEIDEDLGEVEEFVYGDDDGCECDECDDDECGCDDDDCCCCGCHDNDEDDDDDEDDGEFYCAMCPHCGEKVYFDDSVNPEDILCPACQKPLLDDEEDLDEEKDL